MRTGSHTQYLVSQAIRKARKDGVPQEQAVALAMKLKQDILKNTKTQ
jgi:hypothetical protein